MDVKELQSRIEGKVTTATDAGYENLRRELIWNQLTPARYPQLVVQVATEHDVVEAVRFARANRMKIAVRGGGHSWVGFSLRDGSLLIDLGRLNQVSIDHEARRAAIQPAVTGRELNRQLAAHGLAFPVGHCPTVPLSGFLLNGGLGWNFNSWGPACFSVEAANVVTADGSLVVANQEQHADLLWAIRGAGPGFFAVVTQYLLKLYPVPRAITTSTYYYPLQRIEEVGAWAASIARQLPREVELTIFFAPAPPALAEQCRSSNGFVGILSATAFVDTRSEAAATLGPLESCPVASAVPGKGGEPVHPAGRFARYWAVCCGRSATATWPIRSGRTPRLRSSWRRCASISCKRRHRSHWRCACFPPGRRAVLLCSPMPHSR